MSNDTNEERTRQIEVGKTMRESMTFLRDNMVEAEGLYILYMRGIIALLQAHKEEIPTEGEIPTSWQLAREELMNGRCLRCL